MPSPLLRSTAQALEQGQWVLEDLAPRFHAALRELLPSSATGPPSDGSLLGLTMRRYGVAATAPPGIEGRSGELPAVASNAEEVEFWNQLASHIAAGATYRSPSEDDRRLLAAAMALIEEVAPQTAAVFRRWIRWVVTLGGARFGGGSHPHLFGCVFYDEATFASTPGQLAVALVHELGHHELFLLNLFDRLVSEDTHGHLVYAPFQGRPRPPIGRLHAAHALFRMSRFEEDAGLDGERNRQLLRATAETFADWELTEFGQGLRGLYLRESSKAPMQTRAGAPTSACASG